jgi:hypothetical protein
VGTVAAWCFVSAIFLSADLGGAAEFNPASDKTIEDVQCVVVGARLSGSQPQAGAMLLIYYLGRIDGRSPDADLEALVGQEAKKMTASDFSSWTRRCGAEFSARGEQITKIGKSLQLSGT